MKGSLGRYNDVFFFFANDKAVTEKEYNYAWNKSKKQLDYNPKTFLLEALLNPNKNNKPEILLEDTFENITLKVDPKYKFYIVRFCKKNKLELEIKYEGTILVGMPYPIKDREKMPTIAEILNGVITFRSE